MDIKLQALKRQARVGGEAAVWRYIKELERVIAGSRGSQPYLVIESTGFDGDAHSVQLVDTEIEAMRFVLNRIKDMFEGFVDIYPAMGNLIQEMEDEINFTDRTTIPDYDDFVEMWNEDNADLVDEVTMDQSPKFWIFKIDE
jgi:hypothetical protein